MVENQTEGSRLEQSSVIKSLAAEKCKQCEIYRKMCDVYGKACFRQKKMFATMSLSQKDSP